MSDEMSSYTPIVVGVGDAINRSLKLEDALEPVDLIWEAIQTCLCDTGLNTRTSLPDFQALIESVSIIRSWTWPYNDLPGLLSSRLGVQPNHSEYSDHGGEKPVKLFDQAARRIAIGESKVALLAGGEALASLDAFAKAKELPPPGWTAVDQKVDSVFSPTTSALQKGIGEPHGIGVPVQIYPLYENGNRAHLNQSIHVNHNESAKLYSSFAETARQNEFAWDYGKDEITVEDIGTVNEKNRMISFPYPLLMNAFNTVNLAAACLLTSTEVAENLGIPKEKWIYPLGGAGTRDSLEFWNRPNFYSSPAIERTLDTALDVSGLRRKDVDCYDFYSCFPIVPKLACQHLGLSLSSPKKPITLLGGLTSFGGAGNNYSMHAITAMTRALRSREYRNGLILGNGGVLTYQHAICLSVLPRDVSSWRYPTANLLPTVIKDIPVPQIETFAKGKAIIETYTVVYDRENNPTKAHIVGRLSPANGGQSTPSASNSSLSADLPRFLANHGDETTLKALSSWTNEPIGRLGSVRPDPDCEGRNLFFIESRPETTSFSTIGAHERDDKHKFISKL